MGMGEPLANLDVTVAAVRWLTGAVRPVRPRRHGQHRRPRARASAGSRRWTCRSRWPSALHAPDDALRDDLVPINRVHPLEELLAASRDYRDATRRRLTFEYILIAGINAAPQQADQLAALLQRHVPRAARTSTSSPTTRRPAIPWEAPSRTACHAFAERLQRAGITTTLRRTRGTAIDAACGQLYATYALGSRPHPPAGAGAPPTASPPTPGAPA